MFVKIIKPEILYTYEPSLSKLMTNNEIQKRIDEAYSNLVLDLKRNGKKVRQYALPLVLYSGVNGNNIESDYIEDIVERTALKIECEGNGSLYLYGKRNDGVEKTILSINVLNVLSDVIYLIETYKFYKVRFEGSFTKLEVSLIETGFYKAMIYKVLSITMRGLSINYEDTYKEKADYYEERYKEEFDNMLLSYDADDDDMIEKEEVVDKKKTNISMNDIMR